MEENEHEELEKEVQEEEQLITVKKSDFDFMVKGLRVLMQEKEERDSVPVAEIPLSVQELTGLHALISGKENAIIDEEEEDANTSDFN